MTGVEFDHQRNVCRAPMNRSRGWHPCSTDALHDFLEDFQLRKKLEKEDSFLEIGCGEGHAIHIVKDKAGATGYGIDIYGDKNNPVYFPFYLEGTQRESCRDIFNADFRIADCQNLQDHFHNEMFKVVFSFAALPYVWDKIAAIREAHRVLTVGGFAALHIDTDMSQVDHTVEKFTGIQPSLVSILAHYPDWGDQCSIEERCYEMQWQQILTIKKNTRSLLSTPRYKETRFAEGRFGNAALFTQSVYEL